MDKMLIKKNKKTRIKIVLSGIKPQFIFNATKGRIFMQGALCINTAEFCSSCLITRNFIRLQKSPEISGNVI